VRYPWRLLDFAWDKRHRRRRDETGDSPKVRARNERRETQPSYSGKSKVAVELYFFDRNCGRAKEKAPRQCRRAFSSPKIRTFGLPIQPVATVNATPLIVLYLYAAAVGLVEPV